MTTILSMAVTLKEKMYSPSMYTKRRMLPPGFEPGITALRGQYA